MPSTNATSASGVSRFLRLFRVENWRYLSKFSAWLSQTKAIAKWRNLKVVSGVTGGMAILADFFSSLFSLANRIALGATVLAILFAVIIYWVQPRNKSAERFFARAFLCTWVMALTFLFVAAAYALMGENLIGRTITPIAQLQEKLLPIEEKLDVIVKDVSAIRKSGERQEESLNRIETKSQSTAEDMTKVLESSERQEGTLARVEGSAESIEEGVAQIDTSMTLSLAIETLDRAVQSKSNAMQGQDNAIKILIDAGHSFRSVEYSGIALRKADLSGADFSEANLEGADLDGAVLSGANFSAVGFEFGSLRNIKANSADFSRAFLVYSQWTGANLENADFSRANLLGTTLRGANLRNVDFSGASLVGADLRDADLRGAKLNNAVLFGAVLYGAKLDGAVFNNTDIGSAVGLEPSLGLVGPQVCARMGNGYLNPSIIEVTPSARFKSGFAYDDVFQYIDRPVVPMESQFYNHRCRDVTAEEMAFYSPPLSGQLINGELLGFRMTNELLKTAGRRAKFEQIFRDHTALLNEHLDPAGYYRSGVNTFDGIIQRIQDATRSIEQPAYDCLDNDTAAIIKLKYGYAAPGKFYSPAKLRLMSENNKRAYLSGIVPQPGFRGILSSFPGNSDFNPGSGRPSWGFLFDTTTTENEVGGPVEDAFNSWWQKRQDIFNGEVALCIGTRDTDSSLPGTDSDTFVRNALADTGLTQFVRFDVTDKWVFDVWDQLEPEIQTILSADLGSNFRPKNFDPATRIELLFKINDIKEIDVGQSWKIYVVKADVSEQRIRKLRSSDQAGQ